MCQVAAQESWGGACEAKSAAAIVEDTVRLYNSEQEWNEAAVAGLLLLEETLST